MTYLILAYSTTLIFALNGLRHPIGPGVWRYIPSVVEFVFAPILFPAIVLGSLVYLFKLTRKLLRRNPLDIYNLNSRLKVQ